MNYEILNRRNFLKSAGVAIALPMLESLPEAQAARKIGKTGQTLRMPFQ